jgi:hypothetical protein
VATYRELGGLWAPPTDTFEAIAAVLGAHWRAAATSRPLRLFWSTPVRWLRCADAAASAVTISRPEADSSGTPPGPRRY